MFLMRIWIIVMLGGMLAGHKYLGDKITAGDSKKYELFYRKLSKRAQDE